MQDEGNKEQQPQAGWVFNPGTQSPVANSQDDTLSDGSQQAFVPLQENAVTWTASEYIGNPKTSSWYMMFAGSMVFVCVIVYLLTHDLVSTIVIAILGIAVGIFAARQPQVIEYGLDRSGIHLGSRFFPYSTFKTFSVAVDGAFSHITLSPLKRFGTPVTVHYSPEDEEKIIKTLADYLPYEEHKSDPIENFSRRVRF